MAEEYLDLTEVCKQLQLGEDKVLELLKNGELEAEEIEGEMRFTASSVAACKEKVAGGETVMEGGGEEETGDLDFEEDKESAGVDLGDLESEPGADESDQTSVLKPIGDAESSGAEEEEEPEFHFEDEDDDSTSFMDDEEKPAEAGDELETVTLSSDETEEDSGMVADLLSPEGEEGEVDDSLETVDLAELDSGTEEISDDTDTVPTEGSSAETQLVGDEMDIGEEETIGLDGTESETEDIGGTLLDLGEEGVEEEEGERPLAGVGPSQMRPAVAGDMVSVQASAMANAFLAISLLLLVFAGFMLLSAGLGLYHNPLSMWIFENVGNLFG